MSAMPPVTAFADFERTTMEMLHPPQLGGMWLASAIREVPPQRWLVRGLIPEDAMVVLYGPHGTAKTFLAMDWCLHVAQGTPWRERRVEQSGVLYGGFEGRAGLRKRLQVWTQHNGKPGQNWELPFVLLTDRVNLLDREEVKRFIDACQEYRSKMQDMGVALRMAVFDTLARSMPSGDENKDMGILIDNVDQIRRALGGITALMVHHTGKDPARGTRGHTSLPGAADTLIELSKSDTRLITARVAKQKDEEDGLKVHFRIRRVSLGLDQNGDEQSSCVVVEAEDEELPSRPSRGLRGPAKIAYQLLVQTILDHGKPPPSTEIPQSIQAVVDWQKWRDNCYRGGLVIDEDSTAKRNAFRAAARSLRERGHIGFSDPWVWLAR